MHTAVCKKGRGTRGTTGPPRRRSGDARGSARSNVNCRRQPSIARPPRDASLLPCVCLPPCACLSPSPPRGPCGPARLRAFALDRAPPAVSQSEWLPTGWIHFSYRERERERERETKREIERECGMKGAKGAADMTANGSQGGTSQRSDLLSIKRQSRELFKVSRI